MLNEDHHSDNQLPPAPKLSPTAHQLRPSGPHHSTRPSKMRTTSIITSLFAAFAAAAPADIDARQVPTPLPSQPP